MKILIVTDAWLPQVNGVVRTLGKMSEGLKARGWDVTILGPTGTTISCPTYPEIRLTLEPTHVILENLRHGKPDAIHIATEGPLGRAMRAICIAREWPFTTSFHTRFPEYLKARFALPRRWTYTYLRRFHAPAERVLAPTASIRDELIERGFRNVEVWGRGVDVEMFSPDKRKPLPFTYPIQLYVGRLAVEKNVEAFLKLDIPGTKVLVGDGPERARLEQAYPGAVFLGTLHNERLAEVYAAADVFVFPSRTDTFGLVLLEALASGVPIAAYPTAGPKDVVTDPKVGVLAEHLGDAVEAALLLKKEDCRAFARARSWERSVECFARALVPRPQDGGTCHPPGVTGHQSGVTNHHGGLSASSLEGSRFSVSSLSHSSER